MKDLLKRYQTVAVVSSCVAIPLVLWVVSNSGRDRVHAPERPVLMAMGKIQSGNDI